MMGQSGDGVAGAGSWKEGVKGTELKKATIARPSAPSSSVPFFNSSSLTEIP